MDSTDSDDLPGRPLAPPLLPLPAPTDSTHSTHYAHYAHSIPTLPGVAALLSSSGPASYPPPSTDFMSPNHHSGTRHPLDQHHAVRRSTPPNGSMANPPAVDVATSHNSSLWASVNRNNTSSSTLTSTNNNTTNTTNHLDSSYIEDTPSSRTQDQQFTRRPLPQSTPLPRSSTLTAQVRNVQPQDEPPPPLPPLSPINAHSHRQDSAFSEHSCILSNEASFHLHSDSPSAHLRRPPIPAQHNSDTHLPAPFRTTPSPPTPSSARPSSVARQDQETTTSKFSHGRHSHSRSISYTVPAPPAPIHPVDRLNESSTPVDIKVQNNSRRSGASPSSLPDILPSAARSRYDIEAESQSAMEPRRRSPETAKVTSERSSSTEASTTPRPLPRPVESSNGQRTSPAAETRTVKNHVGSEIAPSLHRPFFQSLHPNPNPTHARQPRCAGCGAIWSYPLPDVTSIQNVGPTQTRNEFARANEGIKAFLQKHREGEEAAYSRWHWDHSHCVLRDQSGFSPSSPSTIDSQDTISQNGKRKAEMPPEDGQISSKLRKVTFDRNSPVPNVRVHPSA